MHLPRDDHAKILFLWRNAETVVIGQSQNPRKSATPGAWSRTAFGWRGAAAAGRYFTTGNTCFTFMAGKPGYDKSVSTDIILQALRQLGVTAGASGRNDLVMETADGPRKISGSAYRETRDRGFHHGTLLLNADLERLADYLNPIPKAAGQGHHLGAFARRQFGGVLPGISHEQVCEAIVQAFCPLWRDGRAGDHFAGRIPRFARFFRAVRQTEQLGMEFRQGAGVQPSA